MFWDAWANTLLSLVRQGTIKSIVKYVFDFIIIFKIHKTGSEHWSSPYSTGFHIVVSQYKNILVFAGNALYTSVHKECHKSSYVDTKSESPGVIKTLTAMIYNMGVPPFFPKQNTLLNTFNVM